MVCICRDFMVQYCDPIMKLTPLRNFTIPILNQAATWVVAVWCTRHDSLMNGADTSLMSWDTNISVKRFCRKAAAPVGTFLAQNTKHLNLFEAPFWCERPDLTNMLTLLHHQKRVLIFGNVTVWMVVFDFIYDFKTRTFRAWVPELRCALTKHTHHRTVCVACLHEVNGSKP